MCILFFADGMNGGWVSPALPLLMSKNSPLEDGPISHNMAGLIGSLLGIGALTGCLSLSLISKYIGFKKALLLCGVPNVVWSLKDHFNQN